MHFEYEITTEEYVQCQALYYELTSGRKRIEGAVAWIVVGLGLIVVAWNEKFLDTAQFLLAAIGAWLIYCGIARFFPALFYRRAYPKSGLPGKKFKLDANEEGFDVAGDLYSWHVQWPGVRVKAENEKVFMLCSQGTIFMIGKRFLTDEQQHEFRRLSGLPPRGNAAS
ncbi:MAG: hypothetical protein LAO19_10860 [Acidobacteriia bacterium]|nr:hypothetical protein [Terriglobia bacterium]